MKDMMNTKNIVKSAMLLLTTATLFISCRREIDAPPVVKDPYQSVKDDATLRFSGGGNVDFKNESDSLITYHDNGTLFGSSKQKFGWATLDGSQFFFLEFEGRPDSIGLRKSVSIYTKQSKGDPVRVDCEKAEVIKVEAGKVWIVYKEKADKPDGVIVQKF